MILVLFGSTVSCVLFCRDSISLLAMLEMFCVLSGRKTRVNVTTTLPGDRLVINTITFPERIKSRIQEGRE